MITRELDRARADMNGVVREKDEYVRQANLIVKKYNRWQAAEYNTIVARCRTARQFLQFDQTKHLYPNIEWLRTRSANPRELHLSYVGIVLPISHSFWQENQPGDLYNCKCDWRVTDKPVTALPGTIVKPAPGLEGNPAVTGQIITEDHPYYERTDNNAVINGMLEMQPNDTYMDIKMNERDTLQLNILAEKDNKEGHRIISQHLEISKDLLNAGKSGIILLPEIAESMLLIKPKFYPGDKLPPNPLKNPDAVLFTGNETYTADYKYMTGSRKPLKKHFDTATEQAEILVIKYKKSRNVRSFSESVVYQFKEHPGLKGIILIDYQGNIYTEMYR